MYSAAYRALRLVGGRNPFYKSFRGSYALVGTTGPGRPFWVKQVGGNIKFHPRYLVVSSNRIKNKILMRERSKHLNIISHNLHEPLVC